MRAVQASGQIIDHDTGKRIADKADMLRQPGSARFTFRVHDSIDAVEPLWRAMQAHPLVSLHQGIEWCRAWLSAHGTAPAIIEIWLDDKPAMILPLEIIHGRLFRSARFIGADHSNINTGLFTDDLLDAATPGLMAALAEGLKGLAIEADCINLTGIPERWRGRAMPLAMLPGQENYNHTFQLDLRDSFDCTLAQINGRKRKKDFRAAERRLERMGGYDYLTATTPSEKAEMLDAFFRLKAARFAETGVPDCFAPVTIRAFFHEAVQASASATDRPLVMHAIKLRDNDDYSAIAGISQKGDHVICQFTTIGSGPERIVSPGEMLFFRMIEDYNRQGARIFDFGMGDSRLKQSWTTTETIPKDVAIPLNPIGRLAALKDEATNRAKALVKQNPALYSFIQRLRAKAQSDGKVEAQNESKTGRGTADDA